jgi:hypothetical protein
MRERRCFYCNSVLAMTANRKINKMFCCQDHKNAFYRERKERAPAKQPRGVNRKPARYCERSGCGQRLERYQKRFCCLQCKIEAFFETRDRTLYEGVPWRASYTAKDASVVRCLFFDEHVSLREIAQRTGFSVGVVTRIIYMRKKPDAGTDNERPSI